MTSPLSEYATGPQGSLPLSTCDQCFADIVWVPTPACSASEPFTVSVPMTVTGEGSQKMYGFVHAGCGLTIRRR